MPSESQFTHNILFFFLLPLNWSLCSTLFFFKKKKTTHPFLISYLLTYYFLMFPSFCDSSGCPVWTLRLHFYSSHCMKQNHVSEKQLNSTQFCSRSLKVAHRDGFFKKKKKKEKLLVFLMLLRNSVL